MLEEWGHDQPDLIQVDLIVVFAIENFENEFNLLLQRRRQMQVGERTHKLVKVNRLIASGTKKVKDTVVELGRILLALAQRE